MKKLLTLSFLPAMTDLGLLVLRAWLGISMFLIHGLGKAKDFSGTLAMFQEKMGIPKPLAVCAIIAEAVCSVLLVVGLAARPALIFLGTTMAYAFFKVHQAVLIAPPDVRTGELAFIYLGGFVALLLTGPGRFSVDARLR
jgi:putative oxidoreductase